MGTHLHYIFVHGTAGWGSYDERYERLPYWGMRTGDLTAHLRERGFDCHAASVSPSGSAWDRACELYAQLAGAEVDYGRTHSERFGHARYGADFTGRALIDSFDDETRLVLVGHSFGGTTARMFAELMAHHGDEAERESSDPAELAGLITRRSQVQILATRPTLTQVSSLIGRAGLFSYAPFEPSAVTLGRFS